MKVLILFESSHVGGAERSLSRMALASLNDIHYSLGTSLSGGSWVSWVKDEGIEPLVFGRDKGFLSRVQMLYRVIQYVNNSDTDVIYVSGFRLSFQLRMLKWFTPKTKHIHAIRWNPNSQSNLDRVFRYFERFTSFLLDGWITNSQAAKDTIVNACKIDQSKIEVIYNGIDFQVLNSKMQDKKTFEVVTVANFLPCKGLLEYLDVILKVSKALPNIKVHLVGQDHMNGQVQRKVKKLGLQEKVYIHGFQNDITPWLNKSKIFVLPSVREGCPTVILEAFKYKLPVIANDIDGISELVDNHEDGILLKPNDEQWPQTIVDLLNDPKKLSLMGEKGFEKVSNNFQLKNCYNKHYAYFKKIIEGG